MNPKCQLHLGFIFYASGVPMGPCPMSVFAPPFSMEGAVTGGFVVVGVVVVVGEVVVKQLSEVD